MLGTHFRRRQYLDLGFTPYEDSLGASWTRETACTSLSTHLRGSAAPNRVTDHVR